ncbi:hypothetical protein IKQ21_08005 [bacterium]|nr:hypothetical protein [bacterium]
MKKAFTIVEVSILFVIFLIVAFLVAPLSLDDTMQAKNTSKWKGVQLEFGNIFYSINMQKEKEGFDFKTAFDDTISIELKGNAEPYRITYLNGASPSSTYRFDNYKLTIAKRIMAYKFLDEPEGDLQGYLMYDVNGSVGPNVWGRDVFGYNIYSDRFEPFCKQDSIAIQKQECGKGGTGLCCSNYYLIGGKFD